jgi:hypothetical protein
VSLTRIAGWLWFGLPRRISRLGATLAALAGDGSYLAEPPVLGALAPAAALGAGLALGASHPGETYTHSTLVTMALLAIGALSAALGMAAVAGYAVGDFVLHDRAATFVPPGENVFVTQRVPLIITYLVLAVALTLVPASAASLREWVRSLPIPAGATGLVAVAAGAALVGFLVYGWAKVTAVLVRPVFTWRGLQPAVPDIAPLQERTWWLVAAAVAATVVRGVVEERRRLQRRVDPREQVLAITVALRIEAVNRSAVRRTLVSVTTGVVLALVLSGMIVGLAQGLLVAAFLIAVLLARDALQRSTWPVVTTVERVPVLVRVGVAFVVGRLITEAIVERAWNSLSVTPENTFTPLLVSVCVWAALMTLAAVRRTPPELAMFERDLARSRP